MPGTWERRVTVIPSEVTGEDRGPTDQEKECGVYTKCTKWSLECLQQDRNRVPVEGIDCE